MNDGRRAWIYAGLGLAAGVGLVVASSPQQQLSGIPQKLTREARILLIGDTLAQGLSASLKQLATERKIPFMVSAAAAIRIETCAVKPIADMLQSFRPTLILVSLGVGDMRMVNPQSARGALDRLLAVLRGSGARVVWLGPPAMPFPDRGVMAMVEATGVPILRATSLKLARAPDGVHLTAAGYAAWAGSIWGWLDRPQEPQRASSEGLGKVQPPGPQGPVYRARRLRRHGSMR